MTGLIPSICSRRNDPESAAGRAGAAVGRRLHPRVVERARAQRAHCREVQRLLQVSSLDRLSCLWCLHRLCHLHSHL